MSFEEEMKGVFPNDTPSVEEVKIGDMSAIRKERNLIPPAKDVHMRIKSASVQSFNEGRYRQIKLQLQIVDGIEGKYKNNVLFQTVTYYADPTFYTKEWFQKKQHLVELKFLCNALGDDLSGVVINDAFLLSLNGKELLGTIKQSKKKDWVDKQGVKVEGEMQNEVVNFKKYELI